MSITDTTFTTNTNTGLPDAEALPITPVSSAYETALELEARQFAARSHASDSKKQRPLRIIVADLEFSYDRTRNGGYRTAEGKDAENDIRWPFHRIASACWFVLRFDPGCDVPDVESVTVLANDEASELKITERFFAALELYPDAVLSTWAGEGKDLPVLRRVASEHGLLLPPQLLDLSPYARARLDLCRAVAGRAAFPHLPEYAAAVGIPCKPSPSKHIGQLVECEVWDKVRDQCLADVLTTSVIGLRHLTAHGVTAVHPQRSLLVLAEAAAKASPASKFVSNTFSSWARGQVAGARLKGTVYRAP
ncbi:hypothetical protein [Porphyrobacter sp. AAP60]|uniref:hypothetical protein n=1 Tax=Porphyrobacter sp. AAP60 TaxID=1523423 RepID=UPI0006B8FEEA|nr:hypothetical protein [Porphyrobacter sp. AAP60]KPF63257.1 hypothetical protein IP79_10185 [Porphyrobacter sp. AAP60]